MHRRAHQLLFAARRSLHECRTHIGSEHAWCNCVHIHARLRQLNRQGLGQRGHRALARRISCQMIRPAKRSQRRNINDSPIVCVCHSASEDLAGAHGSGQVGLDNLRPLCFVLVERCRHLSRARRVHQDVHLAERRDHRVVQSLDRFPVEDIAHHAQRASAKGLNLSGSRFHMLPRAPLQFFLRQPRLLGLPRRATLGISSQFQTPLG